MKLYFALIALFFTFFTNSQDLEAVQEEIDQHLWKPFKQAFENLDAEKLNALYAKDVLRVTPNKIDTQNAFKDGNIKRLNGHKENHTDLKLDFWFDSRHTNEINSYEVGFYRMELSNADGINTIYGQFHIVLRKIDGSWRIIQDWDTSIINGEEIGVKAFEKQKPIQFD